MNADRKISAAVTAAVDLHELVDHDIALDGHGGLDTAPVRPHQQSLVLGEQLLGRALCGTVTLQEQKTISVNQ